MKLLTTLGLTIATLATLSGCATSEPSRVTQTTTTEETTTQAVAPATTTTHVVRTY